MKLRECYEILGIEVGKDPAAIHRAYKQLVLRHHPDRVPNDPDNHARFCRITQAYAILKAIRPRHGNADVVEDACTVCGDFGEVHTGLDGAIKCAACLLAQRRKRLPMPPMAQVRCVAAITLQIAAVGLLAWSVQTQSVPTAAASLALLFGALAALTRDVSRSTIVRN